MTREQLVTMLYRYAQYLTFDTESYYDCYEDFTDAGSISSWALTACNWAVGEAIVNGVKDDVLAPQGQRHPGPGGRHHAAVHRLL